MLTCLLLLLLPDEMGVSSLHVTFPTGEEWAALGALGFQQRRGIQYHWCAEQAAHGSPLFSVQCFTAVATRHPT
jgi:predicted N-acyltransferase